MKKIITAIFTVLLIAAGSLRAEHTANKSRTLEIPAGKVHEDCIELDAGTRVKYTFESSSRLSYNVHYHDDKEIVFPVEEHETDAESDAFTASVKHVYCLMWSNPNTKPAAVQYTYQVQSSES